VEAFRADTHQSRRVEHFRLDEDPQLTAGTEPWKNPAHIFLAQMAREHFAAHRSEVGREIKVAAFI
jgi:hypothetical protein